MLVYDYRCTKCSFQFEVKRGFSGNSSASCPRCQGEAQLVFMPVPIIFKGPGFYTTDNRKEECQPHKDDEVSSKVEE